MMDRKTLLFLSGILLLLSALGGCQPPGIAPTPSPTATPIQTVTSNTNTFNNTKK